MMLLQGTLYDVCALETQTRLVICVETGFQSNIYILKAKSEKLLEDFEVGASVLVTGNYVTRDGCKRFHLDSISKFDFKSCATCKLPLTSEECLMNHDKEITRVTGQWEILNKSYSRSCIELFLHKNGMVFSVSVSSGFWLYSKIDNMCRGDIISIDAWRERDKSKLMFCQKADYFNDI